MRRLWKVLVSTARPPASTAARSDWSPFSARASVVPARIMALRSFLRPAAVIPSSAHCCWRMFAIALIVPEEPAHSFQPVSRKRRLIGSSSRLAASSALSKAFSVRRPLEKNLRV